MKLVLHTGEIKEVDTSFIFNDQYNTIDGERIYDTAVHHIIDDVRLGEFYCCSKKQGTYDEVLEAIAEERSKINKCSECWWHNKLTRIDEKCHKERIVEGNIETINETTVYERSCSYVPKYSEKCVHDIEEKPVLFREVRGRYNYSFFCEYPQGVPDMKPLKQFMIDNAEKYGIVPRWSNQKLSIDNSFMHNKPFGSYRFEVSGWGRDFELENARNRFRFYVDLENKKFILDNGIGYKVVKYLGTNEYNHKTQKSTHQPIKNYDKFAKWFWQIVDDFNAEYGDKEEK